MAKAADSTANTNTRAQNKRAACRILRRFTQFPPCGFGSVPGAVGAKAIKNGFTGVDLKGALLVDALFHVVQKVALKVGNFPAAFAF